MTSRVYPRLRSIWNLALFTVFSVYISSFSAVAWDNLQNVEVNPNGQQTIFQSTANAFTEFADAIKGIATMRSGHPWVALCNDKVSGLSPRFNVTKQNLELAAQFLKSSGDEPDVRLATLDCEATLSSGSSGNLYSRLALVKAQHPVMFTFANGEAAKQIHPDNSTSALRLAWTIREIVKPTIRTVISTRDLHTRCFDHGSCVLVVSNSTLRSQERSLLRTLKRTTFRKTQFMLLNATRYVLSLEPKFPLLETDAVLQYESAGLGVAPPRLIVFEKAKNRTSGSKTGSKKDLAVTAKVHRGKFTHEDLSSFISSVLEDDTQLPLKSLPTIRTRQVAKPAKKEADKDKEKTQTTAKKSTSSAADSKAKKSGTASASSSSSSKANSKPPTTAKTAKTKKAAEPPKQEESWIKPKRVEKVWSPKDLEEEEGSEEEVDLDEEQEEPAEMGSEDESS